MKNKKKKANLLQVLVETLPIKSERFMALSDKVSAIISSVEQLALGSLQLANSLYETELEVINLRKEVEQLKVFQTMIIQKSSEGSMDISLPTPKTQDDDYGSN